MEYPLRSYAVSITYPSTEKANVYSNICPKSLFYSPLKNPLALNNCRYSWNINRAHIIIFKYIDNF